MYARIREHATRKAGQHISLVIRQKRKNNVHQQSHLQKTQCERLPPWPHDPERPAAPRPEKQCKQDKKDEKRPYGSYRVIPNADERDGSFYRERRINRKRDIGKHNSGDHFAPPRDKRPKKPPGKQGENNADVHGRMRECRTRACQRWRE